LSARHAFRAAARKACGPLEFQRRRFRGAIGIRLRPLGLGLGLGDLVARQRQLRLEGRVALQPRHCGGADQAAGVDVALPVHAADDPALAEGMAALQQRIHVLRRGLHQQQCPGPADRRVARGVGADLGQRRLLGRRAGGLAGDDEAPRAVVLVLGRIGGQPGVEQRAPQQHVQAGVPSCEIGTFSAQAKVAAAAGNFSSASLAASAQRGELRSARVPR